MSKGKGAATEEEKPKEKSPEKTTDDEDEEVYIVCLCVYTCHTNGIFISTGAKVEDSHQVCSAADHRGGASHIIL